ncbi:MAG: hypothetical protein A3E80_04150 [Chlamydiae bacterium RIFCSPHIGHO2_12_FULL_49_9]|nr:MAG: hypothetical protein A3E80_04150 [Chlamydiae bacterium RIFCSPHIGHO2_12_FULL_49_9]
MAIEKPTLDPYALPPDEECSCPSLPSPGLIRDGLCKIAEKIRDVALKILQAVAYYCYYLPKRAFSDFKTGAKEIFKGYLLHRLNHEPGEETNRLVALVFSILVFFRIYTGSDSRIGKWQGGASNLSQA